MKHNRLIGHIFRLLLICCLALAGVLSQAQTAQSSINTRLAVYDSVYSFVDMRDSLVQYLATTQDTNPEIIMNYLRFMEFWNARITDSADASYSGIKKALQAYAAGVTTPIIDEADWRLLGPVRVDNYIGMDNQRMGIVSEVLGNPNDDNDILIGTAHSGVWKYNPQTAGWDCVSDMLNFPCLGITSLVRNKFEPDTIYASTGVGEKAERYGTGIIQSFDGGNTWSLMSSFPNATYPYVTRLIADETDDDPGDGLTLYALSGKHIFKSENSGLNWTILFTPPLQDEHSYFNDLSITTRGDLIVTTANAWHNAAEAFYFDYNSSSWSSIDLNVDGDPFAFQHARVTGPHHSTNVHTYYMVCDSIGGLNSKRVVFISIDMGMSWEPHKIINGWDSYGVSFYHQEIVYTHDFPSNPQRLLLGGRELCSMLGGPAYPPPGLDPLGSGHSGINDIEIYGYDPERNLHKILIANNGGVSRLLVNLDEQILEGLTNLNIDFLPITDFVGMGVSQRGPEKIVAGSMYNETFLFEDRNWTHISHPLDESGGDCEIKVDDPQRYFYQEQGEMIEVDGQTSSTLYANLGWPILGLKYELDPLNPDILYAGREKGLNGNGRLQIYDMGPKTTTTRENTLGLTTTGAIAADGNGLIFVSDLDFKNHYTTDAVLIKSTNNGATWTSLNNSLVYYFDNGSPIAKELFKIVGYKSIRDIVIDPDNNQHVYLAISGIYTSDAYGTPIQNDRRVLRSTDGGLSWYDFSENLGAVPCHCLAIHKTDHKKRIFVGNEVGVFWKDLAHPGSNWSTFQEGLPPMIVTDMDIRECSNEMYIATKGRGIFKTSLSEFYEPQTILPSGVNITWNADIKIKSDIVIPYNTRLTIEDCTIEIMTGRKIIIQPGAELIVDNATLTNVCDTVWEGIEVWGNIGYSQFQTVGGYLQGYLELKNNAVIENAHYGVRVWKPEDWSSTGGIIIASDASFRNCWKAVEFMPYENFNPNLPPYTPPYPAAANVSVFRNCSFVVDDDFYRSSFDAQVSQLDVWGVRFLGCNFTDQRTGISLKQELGKGIYTLDASFEVGSLCTASPPIDPCPAIDLTPSSFFGLNMAIAAGGTHSNRNIKVSEAQFEDNVTGIYVSAVDHLVALSNEFVVGGLSDIDDRSYGIRIDNSTSYRVEENSFNGEIHPSQKTFGVFVFESGSDNNQVYRNTFENLDYGQYGIGINRNTVTPFEGLQFLCSENWNAFGVDIFSDFVEFDPYEQYHGIRDYQGYLSASAANDFTLVSSAPEHSLTNRTQNVLTYYYNNASEAPVSYTPAMVIPMQSAAWNACPSNLTGGYGGEALSESQKQEVKDSLAQKETAYLNLLYNYHQLIDGGNTNALLTEIQLSWPEDAWDLRNELLSHSPYLSEEVIREAAEKGILPQAMLLEVCLANPETMRSEALMEFLGNEIPNPLPAYMIDLIRVCREQETARTTLEATLGGYGAQMMFWSNILLADMKQDSLRTSTDSLAHYLHRRQTLSSAYARIEALVADSNFVEAESCLELLPEQYPMNEAETEAFAHYNTWFGFQKSLAQNGRSLMQLNEQEIDALLDLAYAYDRSGAQIRNLLCFRYKLCIELPVNGSGTQPKSLIRTSGNEPENHFHLVQVFPNPANTYLSVSIESNTGVQPLTLTITDVSGRVVYRAYPSLVPGHHLVDTRKWKEGMYLYQVRDPRSTIGSGKFIIRR